MNVNDFKPFVPGDKVTLRLPANDTRAVPHGTIIGTHDGAWDVEVRWSDGSWGRYSELDMALTP